MVRRSRRRGEASQESTASADTLRSYGEKIRRPKPCDIRRSKPCDFRRSKPCDAELVHAFVCSSTANKALSHCAFFFSSQGGLPTVPHCLYAVQTWQYVSLYNYVYV